MSSFKVNLAIDQGSTWVRTFTWKTGTVDASTVVDLTGCAARMQIREEVDSPDVLLELTTVDGRITLGGVAGTITLSLTADETAALTWLEGVYDLEVVMSDNTVRRLMRGKVRVSPEVTR